MKKLFAIGLMFCATSQVASANMATEIQTIQNTECLNTIESTLSTVTHPSYLVLAINPVAAVSAYYVANETREAVLYNLDQYATLIKEIRSNIVKKIPNQAYYSLIKKNLKEHEGDSVLGIEIGKAVVSCIRPHLNFTGTASQQYAIASAALQRIASMKKAVQ